MRWEELGIFQSQGKGLVHSWLIPSHENRAAMMSTTEQGLEGDGIGGRRISRRREKCGPMGRWQVSGKVNMPLRRGFFSPDGPLQGRRDWWHLRVM